MQFARGGEVATSLRLRSGQALRAKNATQDDTTLKSARTSVRYFGNRRLRAALAGQCFCGLSGRRGISVVLSGQIVPTDAQHLHDHAGTVDQGVDASSATVSPGDWDFLHIEFQLSGEKENLGIESPAFDLLQWKNGLCATSCEGLEAALSVLKLQAENDA